VSSLPRPIARVYSLLPLALRDRIRGIKRPFWTMYIAAVRRAAGDRTFMGPFRGMALDRHCYPQTVLGTYESELHQWLERIFATPFAHAIDIGGGTGYYAVGLALRMPRARLTVFELTAGARAVIAKVAQINGVGGRMTLLEACTPLNLAATIVAGEFTFVLIDVEGAELQLLDPVAVPALRGVTMLVETHDIIVPGCRDTIVERFDATHTIEELTNTVRTLADFPASLAPAWRRMFPKLALEAIVEPRGGPQVFMLLTPRTS
jgi:predicted O-methyltransferase YrrM